MEEKYLGLFDSKGSMWREFEESEQRDIKVIVAAYDHENYEGHAYVLFECDGKAYEVFGRHCSCYGLEGQWSPEEFNIEAAKQRLDREYSDYYSSEIRNIVREYISSQEAA